MRPFGPLQQAAEFLEEEDAPTTQLHARRILGLEKDGSDDWSISYQG